MKRTPFVAIAMAALPNAACDRPPPNPYEHRGTFTDVTAGPDYTCAISTVAARCWKFGRVAGASVPPGPFRRLSAGGSHACGIRNDGTISCWGACVQGSCDAPPGTFVDVAVGRSSCALDASGRVTCWGAHASSPAGAFAQIDVGGVGCGVRPDRNVECWGLLDYQMDDSGRGLRRISLEPPAHVQGRARAVGVGAHHACAVLDDQSVACWGDDVAGQASAPPGRFASLALGRHSTCALDVGGSAVCWGAPFSWRHDTYAPPPGPYVRIEIGDHHGCALRASGPLVCWGADQQSQVSGERWLLVRN